MKYQPPAVYLPDGSDSVVLHACCAPCSSAIIECLLYNGIKPIVFYFNPNIHPLEEYEIRKAESIRQCESLGIRWIDGDYDHEMWLKCVAGFESEPERGGRCQLCFNMRMLATAECAAQLGVRFFTTTLASSRWKSIKQIDRAGMYAMDKVGEVEYWSQNWRKGGLQERRNELLKEGGFYNQLYCGCEFSRRDIK
jgi:predicted adenine nucleotide alpha hydrolase (AANH) superfamily ATPase